MRKLDFVIDPLLEYHLSLISERELTAWGKGLKTTKPEVWLRGNATVKVDLGRQTGKSHYIARTADDKDIIVCYDPFHLDTMKKRREIYRMQGSGLRVFSIDEALEFNEEVQDVWICDAGYVGERDKNSLYATFAGKCRRFIMIG